MLRSAILAAASALALSGCATTEPTAVGEGTPWRDAAFSWRAGAVTVSQDDLFRLDLELLKLVQDPAGHGLSPSQKLKHLLGVVYGADSRRFTYAAGHSTTASETWRLKRGDCLSLTVLTYSVARALDMPVQMQEVDTPILFDRRGALDFVNQHVNVLFKRAHRTITEDAEPKDVVVDFEPDFASPKPGRALSERSIYARYLNNIATEHLARGAPELAYAHYKAAIEADPRYAASYGNLALLYRHASLQAEAEQLLNHAVRLAQAGDVPVYAMQQLLAEQGRDGEARRYESILQSRRTRDPYHWISLGVRHLEAGENRRAIAALEQAREMTGNFREVHAFLALAYWRAGEPTRANQELTLLASLGGSESGIAKLRKKINTNSGLPQQN
ncbi:MAG: tetratricopeptide repeat protein [Pseudomonadota bacterium]